MTTTPDDVIELCMDTLKRSEKGTLVATPDALVGLRRALLAITDKAQLAACLDAVASFGHFLESKKDAPGPGTALLKLADEVAQARGRTQSAAQLKQAAFNEFVDVNTDPSAPRFDAKAPEGTFKAGMIGNKFRR